MLEIAVLQKGNICFFYRPKIMTELLTETLHRNDASNCSGHLSVVT